MRVHSNYNNVIQPLCREATNSELIQLLDRSDHTLSLPPRKPLALLTGQETGWASSYGGIETLYAYAGGWGKCPKNFPASWQHGINDPWTYQNFPDILLYGINQDPDRLILASNSDQAETLRKAGYRNVHAFGSPFAYAKPRHLPKRIKNSILYMPAHSLVGMPFENENEINEYCIFIKEQLRKSNKIVYTCLNIACIINRQWWPQLMGHNIPIVAGAFDNDANSYKRIWRLMAQFETISTSSNGSHIYYALAAGCKVVIEGPSISFSKNQMKNDDTFKAYQKKKDSPFFSEELINKRNIFANNFKNPTANQVLGNEATGLNLLYPPRKVRLLLGWQRRDTAYRYANEKLQEIDGVAAALSFRAKCKIKRIFHNCR